MNFDEAVGRIVERAGGNDEIIQQVASAFAANDTAQIRQVMSQYGGIELSDAETASFVQQFQGRYQADPVTGRFWT